MAKVCQVTGKKKMYGNIVSHSNRKARTTRNLNLVTKRYFISKLNESLRFRLCTRAIRTIDKFGTLEEYLRRTPSTRLEPELLKLKQRIFR